MKNYFIAFAAATLACLSNFALHAQAPATKTAVYFGVSADSLDAKARASLDSFARIAKSNPDIELLVTAYTDDRGNTDKNKALATRRANAVVAHLSQHNISTQTKNIAAKGELALNESADLDIEAQRQQNRRVEITLTTFAPKNLTEFYDYQARKNTQVFNINNNKVDYIMGQKGGKLIIPANAFVCQTDKSAPALPITIELREAYTFGDMILQNLTTSSGENILQTGGMMYIAATDANGKPLELKSGKEITVAMPMPQKPLDSMQLFLSDRAGDDNGAVSDWTVTNTSFRNNVNRMPSPRPYSYTSDVFNLSYKNDSIRGSKQFQLEFPKNPISKPQNFTLAEPKMEATLVGEKAFEAANPRKRKESKKKYKARIASEYNAAKLAYQTSYQKHTTDLAAYKQARTEHKNKEISYKKYQDSLEIAWFSLYKDHYAALGVFSTEHKNMSARMAYATDNLRRLLDTKIKFSLGKDANRPEFANIRDSIAAYNAILDTIKAKSFKAELLKLDSFYYNSTVFKLAQDRLLGYYDRQQPQGTGFPPSLKKSKVSFEEALRAVTNDSQASLTTFTANYVDTFAYKLTTQSYIAEEKAFHDYLNSINYKDVLNQIKAFEKKEKELEAAYRSKKHELLEVTDEEILTELSGSFAQISKLAWINCDRFLSYPPKDCEKIIVKCAFDMKIQFFVVVPELSSVLTLNWANDSYISPYNGVPKDLQLKLVALRVDNGKISVSITEGNSKQINSSTLNFKPCNNNTLMTLFANI